MAPIVLAPFANERIREWPLANFQRLIELGLRDGLDFAVCGTRSQRSLANQLVQPFSAERVSNMCGDLAWPDLRSHMQATPFVVANNSGIAHLAADLGKWVLCVFAGSHHWVEWMPRGPRVVTVARMPACAPCCQPLCPNQRDCMVNLTAEFAYGQLLRVMNQAGDRDTGAQCNESARTLWLS